MFNIGLYVNIMDFCVGDVGVVWKNFGYYIENMGDDVL